MIQSKYLFLLSLVISLIAFSCGGDDEDETIAGTYKITGFSSANCDDPELNFSFDFTDGCDMLLGQEVCGDGTISLTEGGTFSVSVTVTALGFSETTTASGSYTVDGNTITICEDGGDCETATFNLGSGKITLMIPDPEDNCVITVSGEKQ